MRERINLRQAAIKHGESLRADLPQSLKCFVVLMAICISAQSVVKANETPDQPKPSCTSRQQIKSAMQPFDTRIELQSGQDLWSDERDDSHGFGVTLEGSKPVQHCCYDREPAVDDQRSALPGYAPGWQSSRRPLLSRFGVLSPEFSDDIHPVKRLGSTSHQPPSPQKFEAATFQTSLESPVQNGHDPWRFHGNGACGVKTWLSETHILEINPRWLNFAIFDSMDLTMTHKPLGPAETEPQLWRSTFTVGLATEWRLSQALGLLAGYRFYDNPIPSTITSGAFPNASQHIVAMGMALREGPHSVALTYGLDFLVSNNDAGISSVRQGENIDPLAHLVALAYNYSF